MNRNKKLFYVIILILLSQLITNCAFFYLRGSADLDYSKLKYPVSLSQNIYMHSKYKKIAKLNLEIMGDKKTDLASILNKEITKHNADGIINFKIIYLKINNKKKTFLWQGLGSLLGNVSAYFYIKGNTTLSILTSVSSLVPYLYADYAFTRPMSLKLEGDLIKIEK